MLTFFLIKTTNILGGGTKLAVENVPLQKILFSQLQATSKLPFFSIRKFRN
jgi:hypothetical protein